MGRIVTGKKLKVGDRIKVINAGMGAYGANNKMATVVGTVPRGKRVSGLSSYNIGVMIKLDNPHEDFHTVYWKVNLHGEYEVLSEKKLNIDADILIKGSKTKVVIGDKVGEARCNLIEDKFNEAYGIILAVARAYKLDNEKFQGIVDALYDDVKRIEEYDTLELIDELRARVED